MTNNPYEPPLSPKTTDQGGHLTATEVAGRRRVIRWIMAAVVVWGAFLSTGMWLSTRRWIGPAVVMGCVFAFLAFWAAMLAARRQET